MSLLSSILLPKLEKELIAMEPEMAQFILKQLQSVGGDILKWVEDKIELPKVESPSDVQQ